MFAQNLLQRFGDQTALSRSLVLSRSLAPGLTTRKVKFVKAGASMSSTSVQRLGSASSTVGLNDGNAIPVLGLGVFKAEAGEACKAAVVSALKQGYRHIDTAQIYQNEEAVGQAVRECGLPRQDVFITSKVRCLRARRDCATYSPITYITCS
jgi:aryl-alcohol dehydrogenase-like predicted oxidoreductase